MVRLAFHAAPVSPAVLLAAAVMLSVGGAQGSATQMVDHASRQLAATDRQQMAQMLANLADAARRFQGDAMNAPSAAPKPVFSVDHRDRRLPHLDDADVTVSQPLRDALLNLPPPIA